MISEYVTHILRNFFCIYNLLYLMCRHNYNVFLSIDASLWQRMRPFGFYKNL